MLHIWGLVSNTYPLIEGLVGSGGKGNWKVEGPKAFEFYSIRDRKFKRH